MTLSTSLIVLVDPHTREKTKVKVIIVENQTTLIYLELSSIY